MKKFLNGKLGWLALFAILLMGAGVGGNFFQIGDGSGTDKEIEFKLGLGDSNPKIKAQTTGLSFGNDTDGFQSFGSGTGSGGSGINVIENPGANVNTNGWTESGGTFTRTTNATDVAEGDGAFEWDADAAAQTLTADSFDITTDKRLHGRLCVTSFWYKDGDSNLTAQVWDGSAALAELTLETSAVYRASGDITFVCPSTGTITLRFLSAADAATVRIDDTFLGTRTPQVGTVQTDWESFTPEFLGQTSWTPGNATIEGRKRRVGNSLEVQVSMIWGSTTSLAGDLYYDLPDGLEASTVGQGSTAAMLGDAFYFDQTASQQYDGGVTTLVGTSTIIFVHTTATGSSVDNNVPFTWDTGDLLRFEAVIPIAEWSGTSTILADDLATANARGKVWGLSTTVIPAGTHVFDFANVKYTDGDMTFDLGGTDRFTIPSDGVYAINARVGSGTIIALGITARIVSSIGTLVESNYQGGTTQALTASVVTDLTAGTTVWLDKTGSGTFTALNTERHVYFTVTRVSDFTAGSPVGVEVASDGKAGLVEYYEETGALDGDYTGGTYKAVRINDNVTVTIYNPTWTGSRTFVYTTLTIGEKFRPVNGDIYFQGEPRASVPIFGVTLGGQIRYLLRDPANLNSVRAENDVNMSTSVRTYSVSYTLQ